MTVVEAIVILIGLAFGVGGTGMLTSVYSLRRPNFRRERIPAVAGLVFVLGGAFIYAYEWLSQGVSIGSAAVYFLVVFGFGLLGFADDVLGDRSVSGFRGHFQALARGRLTTGAAKALGGAVISLVAGFLIGYPLMPLVLLAAVLIALTANALNLLDARPGRCLFGFLIGAVAVIATLAWHHVASVGFLFDIAVGFALLLYFFDARGRAMLGDTGSNTFGAILGVAFALYFSPAWQLALVVILIAFHLWSETHSLSEAIERTGWLRRLDRRIGIR